MAQIKIGVDPEDMLGRQLSDLERTQLPYAASQAANKVAYEIRERWKVQAGRAFDRPTPLTTNAALYRKATKDKPYAEIYIRDEAFKGTPPAKYLLAEVEGGQRRRKGFERLLQSRGLLSPSQFAVMGRGARPNQYGNVPAGQVTRILSQLGAQRDKYQNQTETSASGAGRALRPVASTSSSSGVAVGSGLASTSGSAPAGVRPCARSSSSPIPPPTSSATTSSAWPRARGSG